MTDRVSLDLERLRDWIGRSETAHDVVTPRLVRELGATLDNEPPQGRPGSQAQLAIHWCLAPPVAGASSLGEDGHSSRGGFLPPVPLPHRMWAGGQLEWKDRLLVGDAIERVSRIADVTIKEGRSGTLCFVAVDHLIATERGPAVVERQNIVYRGSQFGVVIAESGIPLPKPQWMRHCKADPVLLFRYSALTFNSHRIHYDRQYAMEIEGYPGLICHGPLQATMLLDFACRIRGRALAFFRFRSVRPLFEGVPFSLCARESGKGFHLWIQTDDGVQTMDAEAHS